MMNFRRVHLCPRFLRLGALLSLLCSALILTAPARAQQGGATVLVVSVRQTIDLGLAPYIARVLREAQETGARAVIFEIDTPGGRLDAALQIRDAIVDTPVRTIAFVEHEALSAGALIAIATQEIYVSPAAVIGAATPIDGAGNAADDKTISAVRSIFRATAELRGRDPVIAEAMVGQAAPNAEADQRSTVLTLTAREAETAGYAAAIVPDRSAALNIAGLADAEVREPALYLAEHAVRVITSPEVAAVLIALGLLLVVIDLFTAGFGLPGLLGIGLLGLFFWGHMLVGLAGWEGVALVGLGILLLAAEIFLIPGFGVAGVLGLVSLIAGIFLSLIGGQIVTDDDIARAAATVTGALVAALIGGLLVFRYLPRMGRLQGMILNARVDIPAAQPPRTRWPWLAGPRLEAQMQRTETPRPSLLGATGIAHSYLRPGGIAEIDGERVDVVSEGDYIPAGEAIEVIADEGYRRVVRRLRKHTGPQGQEGA